MESWVFLLVGSVGAVGAAMALGTVAALVRFRREGEMPGAADDAPLPDTRQIGLLYGRVVLGVVLAVASFLVLRSQGLL